MQVSVGGSPAKLEFSTPVWQYRQSMPSSFTWCLWLNGIGCSGAIRTLVIHSPRSIIYATASVAPSSRMTAAIETFATVFALLRNSCGIRDLRAHQSALNLNQYTSIQSASFTLSLQSPDPRIHAREHHAF